MVTIKKSNSNYSKYYEGQTYLTQLKQFFLKKGAKSKMERLFKKYMIKPSSKKKAEGWSKKTQEKFIKCEQNSTPYVKLKIRKRGKRIKHRVTFLEKKHWLKKALLPFSKVVREKKMDRFLISFDKELENLSSGRSTVMIKRDEFHKLALAKAPFSWKRKKNKKISEKSTSALLLGRLVKRVEDIKSDNYLYRTLEKEQLKSRLRKNHHLRPITPLKFRLNFLKSCSERVSPRIKRLAAIKRQIQDKEAAKLAKKSTINGNK